MKLPYRLLAMDLDGTALGADPAQFAPDVLEAAQEAAARGVTVVFATGRPLSVLPPVIREGSLPWLRYLVLNDGAQIWDRQEKRWLWQQTLRAAVLDGVEQVSEHYRIPVEFIDGAGGYHVRLGWHAQLMQDTGVTAFHRNLLQTRLQPLEAPAASLAPAGIVKINMPRVPADCWDAVCAGLEAAGALPMECCAGALEITSARAGKRQAVEFLAGQLGLSLADVMALGDSGNDLALLQSAGWGVAMGNASDAVKRAANAVTDTNRESGAAKAVRRWLLDA